MKTHKKSLLIYLCTGAAFLLVLCGFILAAVFGTPSVPSDASSDAPNYEAKIAAMGQRFPDGTGIHAVMIDDPERGETLYFDETGVIRKFTKTGTAVRVENDTEMQKSAKDLCAAVSDTAPTGKPAADTDFTFDTGRFKVFFATSDGVFVIEPAESSQILALYRNTLAKLEGTADTN